METFLDIAPLMVSTAFLAGLWFFARKKRKQVTPGITPTETVSSLSAKTTEDFRSVLSAKHIRLTGDNSLVDSPQTSRTNGHAFPKEIASQKTAKHKNRAKPREKPKSILSTALLDQKQQSIEDDFLLAISNKKNAMDKAVADEVERYRADLEDKYSEDLKTKEKLSSFATDIGLDRILIRLADEVSYLRDQGSQVKNLGYVFNGRTKDKDGDEVISLLGPRGSLRIREKKTLPYSPDPDDDTVCYIDYTLYEGSELKFSISCAQTCAEWNNVRCFSVTAFRNSGSWAEQLLEIDRLLRIQSDTERVRAEYFKADEIRDRFQA